MIKRVFCVAVALSMMCLSPVLRGAEGDKGEPLDKRANAAIRRGLDWLKEYQRDDGSWSNNRYPAMTALGLWAFTRSDHPDRDAICKKAADFIAGLVQEDGGIYQPRGLLRLSGGLSVYNTAVSMTALHAYDKRKYKQVILDARTFMSKSQLKGDSENAGAFGYEQSGRGWRARGDLSNTSWALMAMRRTQDMEDLRPKGAEKIDVDWEATLKFIDKLQNKDANDPENYGSFGYGPGNERGETKVEKDGKTVTLRGYGSMTYAALESMIYAQVEPTDPRIRSALEWAGSHWTVDENPGMGTKGLFYYYNIIGKALTVGGVDAIKSEDGEKVIPWKKEIIEKLISEQRKDGSWVNKNNQFWEGDPMLVTAYAILTLEYAMGK